MITMKFGATVGTLGLVVGLFGGLTGETFAQQVVPPSQSPPPKASTTGVPSLRGIVPDPPKSPVDTDPEDVGAAQAGPASGQTVHAIRSAFDLKIQLGDSELIILDVRPTEEYKAGHVPGAVPVDLVTWTKKSLDPQGLADTEFWSEQLGKLGISETNQVCVYGGALPEPARVWWLLKYLGVRHATLLDGGWAAWKAEDYPVSLEGPLVEPAEFKVEVRPELRCTLTQLEERRVDGEIRVLDGRSPREYEGEGRHVEGAINLEWTNFVDASGKLLPAEAIRKKLAEAGITPDDAVITHCMTGGRSSAVMLALEVAGFSKAANYYPGWSEYGQRKPETDEK